MYVIATAGHVDHGKSTLVRALTGMEPDRWTEERRRGMTIDLGYAWTTTDAGQPLAFVDVPGHHRFLSNMLAGLGPAPAVLFVVAADEGWRQQSEEHLRAVDALGIGTGLLVVTRSDLANPAPAIAESLARIARSALGEVEAVAASGRTGQGVDNLRSALTRTVTRLPAPDATAPLRLWIDRSFTIVGSGTVVTGTLGAGRVRVGDTVELDGQPVVVRGLQSLGRDTESVTGVARVAVNLRGTARSDAARGKTLLTPGAWHQTAVCDTRLLADLREHGRTALVAADLPRDLVLHVGSAAVSVRLRPLGSDLARLTLARPLPLHAGDHCVLRNPGQQRVVAGALVLDADPPELTRRGAARSWAQELSSHAADPSPTAVLRREVGRRGVVRTEHLYSLGVQFVPDTDVRESGEWLISPTQWDLWRSDAPRKVDRYLAERPVEPGMPAAALAYQLGLPDVALLEPILAETDLVLAGGRVARTSHRVSLGAAEPAVAELTETLASAPFAAPERNELTRLGLSGKELAAAERAGRLLRIAADVVLLPSAPSLAADILADLQQPFTTSQARQALGTTRRVVIPLLEHLDAVGATERLTDALRRVVPGR